MVVVLAPEAVDVQGDTGALRETLQAVRDHLAAEVANLLALETQLDDAVGTVRQIDDGAAESLVEWGIGVAEAGEAGHGGECLGKGASKGYTDILGSMMVVNCVKRKFSSVSFNGSAHFFGCIASW